MAPVGPTEMPDVPIPTPREQIARRLDDLARDALGHGWRVAATSIRTLLVWVDAGGPKDGLEPLQSLLRRISKRAAEEHAAGRAQASALVEEAVALLIPPRPDFGHGPAGGSAYEDRMQAEWDRDYGELPGAGRSGNNSPLGQVFDRAPVEPPAETGAHRSVAEMEHALASNPDAEGDEIALFEQPGAPPSSREPTFEGSR